jgi:hypothetical protein
MFRDSRWWYHYWKRKGHISKNLEFSYKKIDSAELYDNRKEPFENGEENYIHGYKIILFKDYVLIKLFQNEPKFQYSISIATTACNYGGERHWFICPNPTCKKKAKILYLHNYVFVCRKCLNLGYYSQRRLPHMRYILMRDKIEEKLKSKGGDIHTKPKYMHKKTFDKLRDKYWEYENKAEEYLMKHYPLFL